MGDLIHGDAASYEYGVDVIDMTVTPLALGIDKDGDDEDGDDIEADLDAMLRDRIAAGVAADTRGCQNNECSDHDADPHKLEITRAYAGGAIYTDAALDQVDLKRATELWRHRIRNGFAATAPRLMPEPGEKYQARQIEHLRMLAEPRTAPPRQVPFGNVCPHSTPECRAVCLESSGQGWRSTVQASVPCVPRSSPCIR